MTKYLILTILIIPNFCFCQLFINASIGLPTSATQKASMDVRSADIDADGDIDIVLANEFQSNNILLNNGDGTFAESAMDNLLQANFDSEDVVIADFNNDNILDIVFCSEDNLVHEYYEGEGKGRFNLSAHQLPNSEANAVVSFDVNEDGFLDLLFGNSGLNNLLLNDGAGQFELANERIPAIARTTQDILIVDVDKDGDMDIFEGNENGNILLINDGDGFFSDQSDMRLPSGLNLETRKVSFGDVDGDDDPDLFLSNVEFIPGRQRQNRLFLNNGEGHFVDATDSNLPIDNDLTVDAIFEDVDLDDDLDLIVCNVFGSHIKVYLNDSDGVFTDGTLDILGQFYFRDALGIVANDFNGDGLNDLYICDRKNPNTNNTDLLLLRSITTSTTADKEDTKEYIKLFPNPVSNLLSVEIDKDKFDSVLVVNSSFQEMKTLKVFNNKMEIDFSDLSSGNYFILGKSNNTSEVLGNVIKK